jgi:hypothetical protein
MKKVLSIVLAIVMIASMATVAFAATGSMGDVASTTATGNSDHPVYGTYTIGDRTDMYRVTVAWGSMEFIYTEAAEVWNTEDYTWDTAEIGTWAPAATDANKVELTNHSSKDVTVALSFEDKADADTLTGNFDKATIVLDAVVGEGDDAVVDSDSALLSLTGDFNDEAAQKAEIGTVKAVIA